MYLIGDDWELVVIVLSLVVVEYKYDVFMFSWFCKCDYFVYLFIADKTIGKRKLMTAFEKKCYMYDFYWSGVVEFICMNEFNIVDGGFLKEGFCDELIVENMKKGEVVGGDEMFADVEDGDDSNRDVFIDLLDELVKKK